jgi:hypothetical protein
MRNTLLDTLLADTVAANIMNAPQIFVQLFSKLVPLKPIILKKNVNKLQMTLLIAVVNANLPQTPTPKKRNVRLTHVSKFSTFVLK